VTVTDNVVQIGCKQHPLERWLSMSDEELKAVDEEALELKAKHGAEIEELARAHQTQTRG